MSQNRTTLGQTANKMSLRQYREVSDFTEESEIDFKWYNTIKSNYDMLKTMTRCNEYPIFGCNHDKANGLWITRITYKVRDGNDFIDKISTGSDRLKRNSKAQAIHDFRINAELMSECVDFEIKITMLQFFKESLQYMNAVMNSFRQNKDMIQTKLGIVNYVEWKIQSCNTGFTCKAELLLNKIGKKIIVVTGSSKRLVRNHLDNDVAEQCITINSKLFEEFRDTIPLPQSLQSYVEDKVVINDEIQGQMMAMGAALGASLLKPVVGKVTETAVGLTGNILNGVVGLAGNTIGKLIPFKPIKEPPKTVQNMGENQIAKELYDLIQGAMNLDKLENWTCANKFMPTFVDLMASGKGNENTIESMRLNPRRGINQVENPMVELHTIRDLTRIPSYLDSFLITTDAVVEQKLYTKLMGPKYFKDTQIGYFSDYYQYWMGGFVIHGTVFKTTFHTFALMISYTPFVSDVTYNQAKSAPLVQIIDMKENNEFTLHIPYTAITGLRPTENDQPMGVFNVWLQNKLVNNNTASEEIECFMTICGDEDFCYTGIVGQSEPLGTMGDVVTGEAEGESESAGQTQLVLDTSLPPQVMTKENFTDLKNMSFTTKEQKVTYTTNRKFRADTITITKNLSRTPGYFYSASLTDLLLQDPCLINTTMFSRTAQNVPEFIITLIPSSVKTMAGAVAFGILYQPETLNVKDNVYKSRLTFRDAIKRGAQIIDFSMSNEITFKIPYYNRMPILSQIDNRSNFLDYVYIYGWIISPLRVGDETLDEFTIQLIMDMGETTFTTIMPEFDCIGRRTRNRDYLQIRGQSEDISESLLGNVNGISININEDHEVIGDILKRYSKSMSVTVNGSVSVPIPANFVNRGIQGAILKCFKNSRMSLDLMLHVLPATTRNMSPLLKQELKALPIIPLDSNTVNMVNNITTVPTVNSFTRVTTAGITNMPANGPINDIELFGNENIQWTWGDTDGKKWVNTNQSSPDPATDIYNRTLNDKFRPVNSNNTSIKELQNATRLRIDEIKTYLDGNNINVTDIKTAMDNNLGLNNFNSQVNGSFVNAVNSINPLASNSNGNVTKQNANNNVLASAIGEGGDVIVTGGIIVQVGWQPYTGKTPPPFASGNGSTMINTAINPVKVIHAPRYNLYNFEELNGVLANLPDYFYRSTLYIGELLLYSTTPCVVDIYARVSDDAQLIYHIGTPSIEPPPPTEEIRGQSSTAQDFIDLVDGQDIEQSTSFGQKMKKMMTPKTVSNVNKTTIETQQIIKNVANADIVNKIANTTDEAGKLCVSLTKSSESFTGLVDIVKDKIMGISDSIKKLIPEGMDFSFESIVSSVLQFLLAMLNPTPTSIIMTTLSILVTIKLISINHITKIFNFFKDKLSFTSKENRQKEEIKGQCEHGCIICTEDECIVGCAKCQLYKDNEAKPLLDDDSKASLLALVAGCVSAAIGFKAFPDRGMMYRLFNMNMGFWRTINGAKNFFLNMISLIKRLTQSIYKKSKDLKVERRLWNQQQLIEHYNEMTHLQQKMNEDYIMKNPEGQARFMRCYLQSIEYKNALIGASTKDLLDFKSNVEKFLKVADANYSVLSNSISRREPFVIKYFGDTGVGKSFRAMLDGITVVNKGFGITTLSNPIYPMTPGVEFMNGYTSQPIFHIDELFPVKEPKAQADMAHFIMGLKSSSIMNANKASLEDKNINLSPDLVQICTNHAFMVPNVVQCKDAFLRRCDLLVAQRLKLLERHLQQDPPLRTNHINDFVQDFPSIIGRVKTSDYTPEEKEDPDNMYEFCIYTDPTDRNSYKKTTTGEAIWLSHSDFMAYYIEVARVYHEQEKKNEILRIKEQTRYIKTNMDLEKDTMDRVIERAQHHMDISETITEKMIKNKMTDVMGLIQKVEEQEDEFEELEGQSPPLDKKQVIIRKKQSMVRQWANHLINKTKSTHTIYGHCIQCKLDGHDQSVDTLYYVCQNRGKFIPTHYRAKYEQCDNGICISCSNKLTLPQIRKLFKDHSMCKCNQGFMSAVTTTGFMSYIIYKLKKNYFKWKNNLRAFYDDVKGFSYKDLFFSLEGATAIFLFASACATTTTIMFQGEEMNLQPVEPSIKVVPAPHQPIFYPLKMRSAVLKTCEHHSIYHLIADGASYTGDVEVKFSDNTYTVIANNFEHRVINDLCCKECVYPKIRANLINYWIDQNLTWVDYIRGRIKMNDKDSLKNIPPELLLTIDSKYKVEKQKTNFYEYMINKNWFKKGIKILMWATGIAAAIGFFMGMRSLFKNVFDKEDKPKGQYGHGGTVKTKGKITKANIKHINKVLEAQSGNNQTEAIISKIRNNVVVFKVVNPQNNETLHYTCLGLANNVGLMNLHEAKMILHLRDNRKLDVTYSYVNNDEQNWKWRKANNLKFSIVKAGQAVGWNLVRVNFDKGRQFSNIVNYAMTDDQFAYYTNDVTMMEVSKREYGVTSYHDVRIRGLMTKPEISKNSEINHQETVNNLFKSNYTGAGRCGSLMINRELQTPLMGYHCAGTTIEGYQIPLTQKFLKKILTGVEIIEGQSDVWAASANILATVEDKLKPFYGTKTAILKSEYFDELKSEGFIDYTCPAVLSHKDPRWIELGETRTPLMVGAEKHMINPVKPFDPVHVQIAANDVLAMLINKAPAYIDVKKPIRMKEAIGGLVVGGKVIIDPMKLSSSAGWPHNLSPRKQKKDYIILERDEHGNIVEFKYDKEKYELYLEELELRKQGTPCAAVFSDAIKDERRSKEKIQPRIYSIGEMNQLITFKQAFGVFCTSFTRHFADCEHAVGLNVNGPDWSNMVQRLQSKGNAVFDGDFKDFGPRLPRQLVEAAFDVMIYWYDHFSYDENTQEFQEWQNVRRALAREVVYARHIVMDLIYEAAGGIPSGHPATTIVNSIAHLILLRTIWLSLAKPFNMATMNDYNENVYAIVCGDDEVVNVSDEVKNFFNCKEISKFLKDNHDFTYTDASKNDNVEYKTIFEITFLKNHVLKHPTRSGEYLAALDWKVVQETPLWIHKGLGKLEASELNCEQALRLGFGHGPEKFNDLKNKLNKVLSRNKRDVLKLEWFELDQSIFENGYILLDDILGLWV